MGSNAVSQVRMNSFILAAASGFDERDAAPETQRQYIR